MIDLAAAIDRRARPRIFDTDWLLLRELVRTVDTCAADLARPGIVALDFGCGERPYRRFFEARGAEYRGADFGTSADIPISSEGIVSAPDKSADVILSLQVLEHVRDLETYLSEANRLLRPGGKLVLSTHGTWLYHPHPEDHRRWTREGLIHELESRGWKVEHCESLVGPLAWTTIIRLTGFCVMLRAIPGVGRLAGALLAVLMNTRAALEDMLTPRQVTRDNACIYLVRAVVACGNE